MTVGPGSFTGRPRRPQHGAGPGPGRRPAVPGRVHAGRPGRRASQGRSADARGHDRRRARRAGLRRRLRRARRAPLGEPRSEAAGGDRRARRRARWPFVGDGAERYRAEILARRPDAPLPAAQPLSRRRRSARLAEPRLAAGEGTARARCGRCTCARRTSGRAAREPRRPLPPYVVEAAARRRRRGAGQPRAALLHASLERARVPGRAAPRRARPGARRARARGPRIPERGILGYCVIETAADELHVHNLAVRPELSGRRAGPPAARPSRSTIGGAAGSARGAAGGAREQPARHRALSLDGVSRPSPCAATTTRSPRRTRSSCARTASGTSEINLEIAGSGW